MSEVEVLGFNTNGWLGKATLLGRDGIPSDGSVGTIAVVGSAGSCDGVAQVFSEDLSPWQSARISNLSSEIYETALAAGPLWVVALSDTNESGAHGGYLNPSSYGAARDLMGSVFRYDQVSRCSSLLVVFYGASPEEKRGALSGLEIGSYLYKDPNRQRLPKLYLSGCTEKQLDEARAGAVGTNLARHLVNSPANLLNPASYPELVKSLFKGSRQTKVQVWDYECCRKEKLNLLCAVGEASENKPCLIHIKYRPEAKRNKAPTAYVGKGITFDSGGLDIKPGSAMRLMKKDMGGSASVVGLAYWLDRSGYDHPADLYLAIAENAVSGNAFRPGDVISARNGVSVEIDNTDAEGRLVLADALCVATDEKQQEPPRQVINLATLTGAMRVALGQRIAGYFSNSDDLADKVADAAYAQGEPAWRMPLYNPYNEQLNSTVADVVNAGGRFGGAITAALFLERFVHAKPWAHLDIYTWTDKAEGCWNEPGGNGQGVQTLIGFVQGKH